MSNKGDNQGGATIYPLDQFQGDDMNRKLNAGDVIVVEQDTVNADVIENMQAALRAFKRDATVVPDEPPPWEDGWQPVSKKGKIAKRVSKWMHEQGVSLMPSDVSWLGNIAANAITPAGTRIEITDRFDWNPGDFGDEDSCFFGGRRKSWGILHALGGRAAKIYPPDRKPGRCLILDWEDKPYIFNFYGVTKEEGVGIWKAALGETLNPVAFRVRGNRDYPIYINNSTAFTIGGRRGEYVNVENDEVVQLTSDDITRCEYCYKVVADAPLYGSSPRPTSYLCWECYEKLKDSTEPRWANAALVPVPSKPKKKKVESAPTEDEILRAWQEFGERSGRARMAGAFTYSAPSDWSAVAGNTTYVNLAPPPLRTRNDDIRLAINEYIEAHNLCNCVVCMDGYHRRINDAVAANPHAAYADATSLVSAILSMYRAETLTDGTRVLLS
jgi:hypothetical protein